MDWIDELKNEAGEYKPTVQFIEDIDNYLSNKDYEGIFDYISNIAEFDYDNDLEWIMKYIPYKSIYYKLYNIYDEVINEFNYNEINEFIKKIEDYEIIENKETVLDTKSNTKTFNEQIEEFLKINNE
jgi:hypothetical protein